LTPAARLWEGAAHRRRRDLQQCEQSRDRHRREPVVPESTLAGDDPYVGGIVFGVPPISEDHPLKISVRHR